MDRDNKIIFENYQKVCNPGNSIDACPPPVESPVLAKFMWEAWEVFKYKFKSEKYFPIPQQTQNLKNALVKYYNSLPRQRQQQIVSEINKDKSNYGNIDYILQITADFIINRQIFNTPEFINNPADKPPKLS